MQEKHFPFDKNFSEEQATRKLILFNDDINTFDHVIETLMYHCGFTEMQAEQCAWITHTKGKCIVKEGSFDDLEPVANRLADEGLTVEIQ